MILKISRIILVERRVSVSFIFIKLDNLKNPATEPLKVRHPVKMINICKKLGYGMFIVSLIPIKPEAKPPKPFNKATICGNCDIVVLREPIIPTVPPNSMLIAA